MLVQKNIKPFLLQQGIEKEEINLFYPFETLNHLYVMELSERNIDSSGYVLHTLKAAFWCFMTTESYEEAVLKAVNLGGDTDTTAAVTGGLAGIFYGFDKIPEQWRKQIARHDDICDLSERLAWKLIVNFGDIRPHISDDTYCLPASKTR
jgi:ADP-ribosylglycohydrolase